jgi:hypothetical protein
MLNDGDRLEDALQNVVQSEAPDEKLEALRAKTEMSQALCLSEIAEIEAEAGAMTTETLKARLVEVIKTHNDDLLGPNQEALKRKIMDSAKRYGEVTQAIIKNIFGIHE